MATSLLRSIARPLVLSALVVQVNDASAQQCLFSEPFTYGDSTLLRHPEKDAYVFAIKHVKIDADGAPNAYHPDDIHLNCETGTGFKGLDCPANGGYGTSWWRSALVPDPANDSKPYVQPSPSEFAGYFVSQTSLTDPAKAAIDPARYVDARTVPYLVFPRNFQAMQGTGFIGDIGYAINTSNGKTSPFIVADTGPSKATLGEMSIALAKALGGADPNPRTGTGLPTGKILVLVLRRSFAHPKWPLSSMEIDATANKHLTALGGKQQLLACADRLKPK